MLQLLANHFPQKILTLKKTQPRKKIRISRVHKEIYISSQEKTNKNHIFIETEQDLQPNNSKAVNNTEEKEIFYTNLLPTVYISPI